MSETASKNYIVRLWSGDLPLVQTFWLYFMLPNFLLKLAERALYPDKPFFWDLVVIHLVWGATMVPPIWIAAGKYKGPAIWAISARVFAVLIAVSVFIYGSWVMHWHIRLAPFR